MRSRTHQLQVTRLATNDCRSALSRRLPPDVQARFQAWSASFQNAGLDSGVTYPFQASGVSTVVNACETLRCGISQGPIRLSRDQDRLNQLETEVAALQASQDPQALFMSYVQEAVDHACEPAQVIFGESYAQHKLPVSRNVRPLLP